MGLPLQAHTNVRDVLAPLFSNGRSFSSLIDELSRHFKLEPSVGRSYGGAYGDDPAGVLEASSESQSTDSEAEVCAQFSINIIFKVQPGMYCCCVPGIRSPGTYAFGCPPN